MYNVFGLCICGKMCICIREIVGYVKYFNEQGTSISNIQYLTNYEHTSFKPSMSFDQDKNPQWFDIDEKIFKLVDTPVFLIQDNCLMNQIPCLRDWGMETILDLHQTYQDIETWISSILKDNPDTMPLSQIDNVTLLEKKGFDKKTSFRHPIK